MTLREHAIYRALRDYPEAVQAYETLQAAKRAYRFGPRGIGKSEELAQAEANFGYHVDRVISQGVRPCLS